MEWQIRFSGAVLLDALASAHHDRLAPAQLGHEDVDEGSLSDAWLASHEDRLPVAAPGRLESYPEPRQLFVASHACVWLRVRVLGRRIQKGCSPTCPGRLDSVAWFATLVVVCRLEPPRLVWSLGTFRMENRVRFRI